MLETVGRYKIIEKLGEGGIGSVYLAEDPAIGRQIAIKVIPLTSESGDLAQRIQREVRVLGKLSHPNIITLYDVGQIAEYVYIAMEYVDGGTLTARLREQDLGQRETRQVLSSVATALDYAHEREIVHRDIKPSNIMFTRTGVVKVVDFGIARAISAAKKSKEPAIDVITRPDIVIGTPGFLAPEQFRGSEADISGASDEFSLACVAYLLLTGQAPFEGDSVEQSLSNVLFYDPPGVPMLNSSLGQTVDSILRKALAKQPVERYPNCVSFVAELMEACDKNPSWVPANQLRSYSPKAMFDTQLPMLQPLHTTPTVAPPSASLYKDAPSHQAPGEFTLMFSKLAASGSLHAPDGNIPTVFPEPRTGYFRAQNERFQKIEESIKFYRDNLTSEYQTLTRQADLTYKLWLGCVGLGFAILASGVTLMFKGDIQKGVITAASTVLVYFIQRVFHQREDYYRNSADAKSRHLQYGNQWLLVIQSVDAIEDSSERVKRQTALVDVLTDRLRSDQSLAPRSGKRSTKQDHSGAS